MEMSEPAKQSYDMNAAQMEKVFIGISGLIGAGKSTLAHALAKRLDLPCYEEPVKQNDYLADFYKDMKKYSFPMQVYLLNLRFQAQQMLIWSGRGGVQDRTIYEDSVFARMLRDAGLMEERDYRTYLSLFNHMSNFMRKPNIIVHLDVSPEESLRRIKMRGRECEAGITLEYLQGLHAAYEEFIHDIARVVPVIKVDWKTFRDTEEVVEKIAQEYARIANVREVKFDSRGDRTPSPKALRGSMSPASSVSATPGSSVSKITAAPTGAGAGAGAGGAVDAADVVVEDAPAAAAAAPATTPVADA